MISVTDEAKELLKETLLANTDDRELGLRLKMEASGDFGLIPDKEAEGDQVVEHDRVKVLLVAEEVGAMVKGYTLDVQYTAAGPKLVLLIIS